MIIACGLAGACLAADEFTIIGWHYARVNGLVLVPGTPMPSGVTIEPIDGAKASFVQVQATQSIQRRHTGPLSTLNSAQAHFTFKAKTTNPNPPTNVRVSATRISSATTMAQTMAEFSSARGRAYWDTVLKQVAEAEDNDPLDEPAPIILQKKVTFRFSGVTLQTEPDGKKSFVGQYETHFVGASARATGPGFGGTMLAATGSATSSVKVYPYSIQSTGQIIAGVADVIYHHLGGGTPVGIEMDVYSANNVPLDMWSVNVSSAGTWDSLFNEYPAGNYKLYFYTGGSLRKRVDISWNGSQPVTGIDARLKFGDLNMDNYISSAEVAYIYANIGMTHTSPDWHWGAGPGGVAPIQADLNADGAITIADYNMAAPNVGLYGD